MPGIPISLSQLSVGLSALVFPSIFCCLSFCLSVFLLCPLALHPSLHTLTRMSGNTYGGANYMVCAVMCENVQIAS